MFQILKSGVHKAESVRFDEFVGKINFGFEKSGMPSINIRC